MEIIERLFDHVAVSGGRAKGVSSRDLEMGDGNSLDG